MTFLTFPSHTLQVARLTYMRAWSKSGLPESQAVA